MPLSLVRLACSRLKLVHKVLGVVGVLQVACNSENEYYLLDSTLLLHLALGNPTPNRSYK